MFPRSIFALLVGLLTVLGLTASMTVRAPDAGAIESASDTTTRTESYADADLLSALQASDMVEEWIASSPVSDQAALIEVSGSARYTELRQELLVMLGALGERQQQIVSRTDRVRSATKHLDLLDALIRQVRRSLTSSDRTAARSLSEAEATQVRVGLAKIDGQAHWLGFSLDPLAMAEHRLAAARDDVAREVEGLTKPGNPDEKTPTTVVARLSALQQVLGEIQALVNVGAERATETQQGLAVQRASVAAFMPALHELRTLAATSVDGLPLVTLDAYIRGAATLDDGCPVDWTLLAGIGRIESGHGTINDGSVHASGRVSQSILGPLLDGGATEREAEAAALAVEEAILLAEQEAAEAERIAAEEAHEASVWGQLERSEAIGGSVVSTDDADEGVIVARPNEEDVQASDAEDEDEDEPEHDPALWGEPPPRDPADEDDAEDGDEAAEDEAAEDEEELQEFKGNGFAVIEDSDDGRLDGNARWDRAVGPMQFIPETWSYWQTDGNGDGVTDPQNLYDAAASAGRFLCHLSRSLGPSPFTFVLGYNSSQTYVRNVMSAAEALRIAELPNVTD